MSWRRHVPSLRIHDSCWKSHTFHMHVAWNKESIQGSTYSWVNRFTTGRCRLLQMGLPDSKTCLAANVISARCPACAGMCSNLRFWIHGKVMYPACICMCMHACMHACMRLRTCLLWRLARAIGSLVWLEQPKHNGVHMMLAPWWQDVLRSQKVSRLSRVRGKVMHAWGHCALGPIYRMIRAL